VLLLTWRERQKSQKSQPFNILPSDAEEVDLSSFELIEDFDDEVGRAQGVWGGIEESEASIIATHDQGSALYVLQSAYRCDLPSSLRRSKHALRSRRCIIVQGLR
jgi:hypothetical protein